VHHDGAPPVRILNRKRERHGDTQAALAHFRLGEGATTEDPREETFHSTQNSFLELCLPAYPDLSEQEQRRIASRVPGVR
jgi:hypothetical protein